MICKIYSIVMIPQITIFVLIVCFMMLYESETNDMTYVKCQENFIEYRVQNLPDKQSAANLIGRTHEKLKQACQILQKRHNSDPRVHRLVTRFKNTTLVESPGKAGQTSYSINKGEKIALCVRKKDGTNELIDDNLLLFVALHELSHIMTKSKGHQEEFWNNFKFVLESCQAEGLYKCIDFSKTPQQYCGMTVTNSPAKCEV